MYKKDFPMSQEYVMFDSAAIALKPTIMVDAITDFYLKKANNPHSKDSYLAKDTLEKIEGTRASIAKLVNSKPQEVIFTSGASHSINLLVGSIVETLSEEDNVIVFMDSHASGVIP
jgi:selenocysteine lyase/cysteine desulfurase